MQHVLLRSRIQELHLHLLDLHRYFSRPGAMDSDGHHVPLLKLFERGWMVVNKEPPPG